MRNNSDMNGHAGRALLVLGLMGMLSCSPPQVPRPEGNPWVPDNGDGTYTNPVLYADYSDPDVIRVGEDFYLTASSFNYAPGLPILHSRDLVNWRIIGHALDAVPPVDTFRIPQYGRGVWAPAIRFQDGEFRIYYGDPDFGIYLVRAKRPEGPWDAPILVRKAKGWIDPCPFWDSDGSAYLVHAWARSRASFNSILTLNRMNREGTAILDDGVTVFDGTRSQPTIEGPKMYFRDGYYYIFAPAGGVRGGWQTVLRAKTIYGPYEDRIVMDRGTTAVNGPHQGGWVELESGESWFLHFQQKGAYGRIVHLQPMVWRDGWPVIGAESGSSGKGEPVLRFRMPAAARADSVRVPQASDDFDSGVPGLQWQWPANPSPGWIRDAGGGILRMAAVSAVPGGRNLREAPNLLLQKFCAPRFSAVARIAARFGSEESRGGLIVMGEDYATLAVTGREGKLLLVQTSCPDARSGGSEVEHGSTPVADGPLILGVDIEEGGVCSFRYSFDGRHFTPIGEKFAAKEDVWTGAKVGLFSAGGGSGAGSIDVDWFHVEPLRVP